MRVGTGRPVVGRSEPATRADFAEVARAVDAASDAFLVKVDLQPDARLQSDVFARVRAGSETRQNSHGA